MKAAVTPQFLVELTQAIQNVEQIPEYPFLEEIKPNETVLGTLSDGSARLFVVIDNLASRLSQDGKTLMHECIELDGTPEHRRSPEHQKKHREVGHLLQRLETVRSIFWQSVREEMDTNEKNLTLRKGMQVVVMPEKLGGASLLSTLLMGGLALEEIEFD